MLVKLGPQVVNAASIRAAYTGVPDLRGVAPVKVQWSDGTLEDLNFCTIEDLEAQTGTIVPAPPGYRLTDGDRAGGEPLAVLAFRVSDGRPIPITAAGEPKSATWVMLLPDGGSIDNTGSLTPAAAPLDERG